MYFKTLSVIVIVALMASAVPAMAETVSVTDADNVLVGSTVTTDGYWYGPASKIVDDVASIGGEEEFIFMHGNNEAIPQLASISGFTTAYDITSIRIYTICNNKPGDDTANGAATRNLVDVTIKSSTSVLTSLDAADYSNTVGYFPLCGAYDGTSASVTIGTGSYGGPEPDGNDNYFVYFDLAASAPAGTQSLFFDFNDTRASSTKDYGHGDRVFEIQGLAPIPEPGTMALLAIGLIGLLCYAWRKRK